MGRSNCPAIWATDKKKMERRSHQTDRTLMIKISQAQTLVESIQAGVPLSRGWIQTRVMMMMTTTTTTMMIGGLLANSVTVRTLKQVNLEKDCPITTFSEKKDSQLFCKRTNNNHKFKDCFLRGQVSLNGFQILNGCIVEFYWSVCKKTCESLVFTKRCDWTI